MSFLNGKRNGMAKQIQSRTRKAGQEASGRDVMRTAVMIGAIASALPLIGGVCGTWSGVLDATGQKYRIVFHVEKC